MAGAIKDEYVTYAPAGETCPLCRKPIGKLEPVYRAEVERASAGPAVVYRHAKCVRAVGGK